MVEIDRTSGYFREDLETKPWAEKKAYLDGKLREIVQYAYGHAKAFKEKLDSVNLTPDDIETIEDLEKIPVTKKADLVEYQKRDFPFGGFVGIPVEELRRIYVSPGPIYEPGESEYDEIAWAQGLYAGGFRPGDIAVNTFNYHMMPFAMNMVDNSLNMIGCITVPTGVGNTELQVNILKNLKATGFCGTPSFLHTIAEKAEEMGLDLRTDLNLKVAFAAAEMLPESLRKTLEDKFGIILRQSYGTADIGSLGYECMEKNGMHLPDDKIVEIADPQTGRQLPVGESGEIVSTTFNKTYPLIRFGTGDLSYLIDEPCPCGRTSPRLVRILGRTDQLTKVRGVFVHPGQADEVARRYPNITAYRVLVTREKDQDVMTFQVELKDEDVDKKRLKEEFRNTIRDVMKVRGDVEFIPQGTIPDDGKKIEDKRSWD
ncbi:MAG: phenylacetate--CoA ligase family protein [Thermodesulfobacteriota bacterium]